MTATLMHPTTQPRPLPARRTPWLLVADLAAVLLFGVEGGLLGIAGGLDLIGVLAVAFISALGGGLVRDVLCRTTPAALGSSTYAATALVGGLVAVVGHQVLAHVPLVVQAPLDAAALGLFCAVGTIKALDLAMRPLAAVMLGVMSAVGGGIIRDVLLGTVPAALRSDMCALAALVGAAVTVVTLRAGASRGVAATLGVVTCAALSLLSAAQGWHLPAVAGLPG
jgi:uncharacterized membrane protein YeiH